MQKQKRSRSIFAGGGRESQVSGPSHVNQLLMQTVPLGCGPRTMSLVSQFGHSIITLVLFKVSPKECYDKLVRPLRQGGACMCMPY